MVKSVLFFITHATLNLEHAKMCLYHLLLSYIDTQIFDEMYIYNTHRHELSNESILELITKYNIYKLCKTIKIFDYDTNTQKKLSHDIFAISSFCQKNYNPNDRILILKSDIMISINLLSDLYNIDSTHPDKSDSFIFTPPFITAKSRVTNKEILDYTRRPKFIKSDNITFYNESSNENIKSSTDHVSNRTPNDDDILFISCECKRDFSCHYITVDNLFDKDWGGVCFEESRDKWISTHNSFTVHKYHSIVSQNRKEEREKSLHNYLNQGVITNNEKAKILLCVTGHIRTFNYTIESLISVINELIKKGYIVDICFSTYNQKYGYHPYIQSTLNFYEDTKLTSDYFHYISSIFKEKFGITVNIVISNNDNETVLAQNTLTTKTRDIYHGFLTNRRLIDCMNMGDATQEKYTYVIKTRFDCKYNIENFCSIFDDERMRENEHKNVIYLDENNVYPNDWILISSYDNIKNLSSSVNSEYINPTSSLSVSNPPHGFLQYFIESNKLNVDTKYLADILRYSNKLQDEMREKRKHIICHRGNINGPSIHENSLDQINMAIALGYDVEIDVRYERMRDEDTYNLYLGHDKAQYLIDFHWILQNKHRLWIHCKDRQSLEFFNNLENPYLNYFYHTDEDYVLTSKFYVWCFPGKPLLKNSICVMPESDYYQDHKDNIWKSSPSTNQWYFIDTNIKGICTDYPYKYLNNTR